MRMASLEQIRGSGLVEKLKHIGIESERWYAVSRGKSC
jgi:hypothetical protein